MNAFDKSVTAAAIFVLVCSAIALGATAQMEEARKAKELAGRPLTDADIAKYCAVRADIARLGTPKNTAADLARHNQDVKAIRARHGITDSEYHVLDGRVMTAETLIRMEKQMPTPAEKKADVEIVRKHLAKIQAAKRAK